MTDDMSLESCILSLVDENRPCSHLETLNEFLNNTDMKRGYMVSSSWYDWQWEENSPLIKTLLRKGFRIYMYEEEGKREWDGFVVDLYGEYYFILIEEIINKKNPDLSYEWRMFIYRKLKVE